MRVRRPALAAEKLSQTVTKKRRPRSAEPAPFNLWRRIERRDSARVPLCARPKITKSREGESRRNGLSLNFECRERFAGACSKDTRLQDRPAALRSVTGTDLSRSGLDRVPAKRTARLTRALHLKFGTRAQGRARRRKSYKKKSQTRAYPLGATHGDRAA